MGRIIRFLGDILGICRHQAKVERMAEFGANRKVGRINLNWLEGIPFPADFLRAGQVRAFIHMQASSYYLEVSTRVMLKRAKRILS